MKIVGHYLLVLALFPILFAQLIWVLLGARKLPEAIGARSGMGGTGPLLRVLIVGDSSAAGVGARTQSKALAGRLQAELEAHFTVDWTLVARSGITTRNALASIDAVEVREFDLCVIALGVNDATRLTGIARWVSRAEELRSVLRSSFNVKCIYQAQVPDLSRFPSIPWPLSITWGRHAALMNTAMCAQLQGDTSTTLLNFDIPITAELMAKDGFHPNDLGYALWAKGLAALIIRDFAPGGGQNF